MADQKPPRMALDERTTLRALLQYQRESFVRKVSGVDTEDADASPVASGTTLLWLANHMADAEVTWILRRFAQRADARAGPPASSIEDAVARYRQVWRQVDAVIDDAAGLDETCPAFDDDPPVNLRWIVAHVLEETARHAGHADILRELVDETTGR